MFGTVLRITTHSKLASKLFLLPLRNGGASANASVSVCDGVIEKCIPLRSLTFVQIGSDDFSWFLSRGAPSSKTLKRATHTVDRVRVFDARLNYFAEA